MSHLQGANGELVEGQPKLPIEKPRFIYRFVELVKKIVLSFALIINYYRSKHNHASHGDGYCIAAAPLSRNGEC